MAWKSLKLYQFLWKDRHFLVRLILIVIGLGIVIRSIPLFIPIQSKDIAQTSHATQFVDRQGLPLGTILSRDQNHTTTVALNEVSPVFIEAILSTEDSTFYHHGAVDTLALGRALLQAIQHRKIVSGASTITMQLSRMLYPSPRTISAKLKEIWTAWRLTAGMTKNEILHAYINRLPMGGNLYGIESASRVYFGISAKDLTLSQATLLAGIPNNPNYLNPYHYLSKAKQRQKYILNRMVQDKKITPKEAELAYQETIVLQNRQQGILSAPHFLFWVSQQLPLDSPAVIQTTLDKSLQEFVSTQVQVIVNNLKTHNVHQGSAIVINNHTGEILAYVGSPNYFSDEAGNNDGVQALRQPGSTLKPFLYQFALEKGILKPNTILADIPTYYRIPNEKIYAPSDYSNTFQGPVRVRIALANSLNVPAVRVLEKVGVTSFLSRLHQLGFEHLTQSPDYYGLGLTLGSGEVSLYELARAYSILAQEGELKPLKSYQNQVFKAEDTINLSSMTAKFNTWQLISDILADKHARAKEFGVESILNLPFPVSVKTGTSSNFRDTWTVGYTKDYTVATWVGNFDGQPLEKISGVMGAAPLWNRIMLHLYEGKFEPVLEAPSGLIKKPMCAITGVKPTTHCRSTVNDFILPEDQAIYEKAEESLPAEYNDWLAKQSQSQFISDQFRITFPQNGNRFVFQPQQFLRFQVAGGGNLPLQWKLNGQVISHHSNKDYIWNLKAGQWTLEVSTVDRTDTVRFTVENPQNILDQKGFSVNP